MSEILNPVEQSRYPRPEVIEGKRAEYYAQELANVGFENPLAPDGTFVDPEEFKYLKEGTGVTLKLDRAVDWPLDSIVSAVSFESWEGRAPGHLKDGRPSKEVIDEYAARETEIPPVDFGLDVFLTREGQILALTHNSHRVAAAKKREQQSIGVTEMTVYSLKELPQELLHRPAGTDIERVGI